MIRHLFVLLLLFASCGGGSREQLPAPPPADNGSAVVADSAMVVSAHPEATAVGVAVMRRGGNAVDASIAVQLALAVVYPAAGNIGGGGFLVLRLKDGTTDALDFREQAPARAHRNMYLDAEGNVVPGLSTETGLSVGVPGTVDGLVAAHAKYGSQPFAALVQPAIDLARNGFPVTRRQAESLNRIEGALRRRNPGGCPLIRPGGWSAGDTLRQPELAQTLALIRDHGRDGFYGGATAGNLVAQVARSGGILSAGDLASYRSVWRSPITCSYKGYDMISMPPPSSGGVALCQLLKMLEHHNLRSLIHNGPDYMHLLAEAEKRAYADRAAHLGDPGFHKVPVGRLTDSTYAVSRLAGFRPDRATPSAEIEAGAFAAAETEETTHLSVVDPQGNAVAVTTTLNAGYGCLIFVAGSGFLLNNEMDDFSVKPGVPNMYGLVGGEANAVAPGKRMLSSMTPTIVERGGRLVMVAGTPGGSTIISSVLQVVLNVLVFGMPVQEAVDAPRFHHQWLPDTVYVEDGRFSNEVLHALEQRGQAVAVRSPIGRVDIIVVRPDGRLEGGADPRGDDTAGGF